MEHFFRNYGVGVRYVKFEHDGQDTQFWAGHYGSKITGSTVKLINEYQPQTTAAGEVVQLKKLYLDFLITYEEHTAKFSNREHSTNT